MNHCAFCGRLVEFTGELNKLNECEECESERLEREEEEAEEYRITNVRAFYRSAGRYAEK